jgi:hypothetical protein
MEDALPQSQPGKFGGCGYADLFRGDRSPCMSQCYTSGHSPEQSQLNMEDGSINRHE